MKIQKVPFALIIFALAASAFAQTAKKSAPAPVDNKEKAPAAVIEAFKKQYPNASIKSVSSEKENGKTVYEIESMDGVQRRDLMYSADGKVLSTEELMKVSDLPKVVVDAVAAKYPKAPISTAEKLTDADGTRYELVIKVGGKNKSIDVDPTGKIK